MTGSAVNHFLYPRFGAVIEVFVPELRRVPRGERVRAFDVRGSHLGFDEYTDFTGQILYSHHYWIDDGNTRTFSAPYRYVEDRAHKPAFCWTSGLGRYVNPRQGPGGGLEALAAERIEVPVTQALASSGLLAGLESRANAVCPGALLYGMSPVSKEISIGGD